ncbi:MAG: ComF family protein [Chloroflexota bacterium]
MSTEVSVFSLSSPRRRYTEAILDFLFPRACINCGQRGALLCQNCFRHLAPVGPACPKCGRPQANDSLCAACWGRESPIDGIHSPYRFQGIARTAIHEFKYHGLRSMAEPLAHLLANYLVKNPVPGDTFLPVPLHSRRLKERGYNQSALLASHLSRLTGIPIEENTLIRLKNTPPQVRSSSVDTRHSNVAGAFACRNEHLRGRSVIIIDDVCTSGATLEACAVAIKAAGASTVHGLTLAREV